MMLYEQEAYGETGALAILCLVDFHQTYWSPFSRRGWEQLSDKTTCELLRLGTSLSSLGLGPICRDDVLLLQCRYNCEPTRPIWSYVAFRESAAWHSTIYIYTLYRFESSIATSRLFGLFSGCPFQGWQRVIIILYPFVSYCTLFVSMSAGMHTVRTQNVRILYHIMFYYSILWYHICYITPYHSYTVGDI